jgi:hypothetical protein
MHTNMKLRPLPFTRPRQALTLTVLLAACAHAPPIARSGDVPAPLLDDFSDPQRTSAGTERLLIDDSSIGGESYGSPAISNGVLSVEGEIAPARGQPGFISLVLPLSPRGKPENLSRYQGIRIRARVTRGELKIEVGSSEIENFDFHATVIAYTSGGMQEIKIPFTDLKRGWSEQTPLNLQTISTINLVAASMEKGPFAYEVDEIGFY